MAKLILSMDGLLIKEVPLIKERTTIGRKPHNDIQIDNLAISGEHAVVLLILNDAFLEDLNSTNGTQVNGQPIKKHFLQNGDVIEMGKYRLKYVNEGAQQQVAPADFEKTMILRADMMRKPPEKTDEKAAMSDTQVSMAKAHMPPPAATATGAFGSTGQMQAAATPAVSAAPPAPAAAPMRGAIQILSGVNVGKEMELTKTLTTLGKPGVQVAVITRRPQGYFITHVEGAVFPVLNGTSIDAHPHALNDHDIVELAGIKMEFFIKT